MDSDEPLIDANQAAPLVKVAPKTMAPVPLISPAAAIVMVPVESKFTVVWRFWSSLPSSAPPATPTPTRLGARPCPTGSR